MNKTTKTIASIAAFAIFLAAATVGYNLLKGKFTVDTNGGIKTEEKTEAPDFTAYDAQGNAVRLSDFKGTPVVLNFWASWCPPCKSELPDFDEAAKKYDKSKVAFLMVDLTDGQRETKEVAKQFIADNGYTFPVLYDTDQSAAINYSINSIPVTVFVDKDGFIRAGYEGAIDRKTLEKGIAVLIE